eukprot:scaffold46_cov164-Skeletonema_menzelii.AAC.1
MSAAWLREDLQDEWWASINGDNSILNTMKIVDGFGSNMCPYNKDEEESQEFVKLLALLFNGNVWSDSNPA